MTPSLKELEALVAALPENPSVELRRATHRILTQVGHERANRSQAWRDGEWSRYVALCRSVQVP